MPALLLQILLNSSNKTETRDWY